MVWCGAVWDALCGVVWCGVVWGEVRLEGVLWSGVGCKRGLLISHYLFIHYMPCITF